MTKIKLCGLSRPCDIETANELLPDYIGFIFAPKSRRYVSPEKAASLKDNLHPEIRTVGVFVNEKPEQIAKLLKEGIIHIAQLHGSCEDEAYIRQLRTLTDRPIIRAFRIDTLQDVARAQSCLADYVLLDSGNGGTGTVFDWSLLHSMERPFFLAGGLDPGNVGRAVAALRPYGVDVSSGIETGGWKDPAKMKQFVHAVREVSDKISGKISEKEGIQ